MPLDGVVGVEQPGLVDTPRTPLGIDLAIELEFVRRKYKKPRS
jgi:hypothetical protein